MIDYKTLEKHDNPGNEINASDSGLELKILRYEQVEENIDCHWAHIRKLLDYSSLVWFSKLENGIRQFLAQRRVLGLTLEKPEPRLTWRQDPIETHSIPKSHLRPLCRRKTQKSQKTRNRPQPAQLQHRRRQTKIVTLSMPSLHCQTESTKAMLPRNPSNPCRDCFAGTKTNSIGSNTFYTNISGLPVELVRPFSNKVN